jgi:hypothetical protein
MRPHLHLSVTLALALLLAPAASMAQEALPALYHFSGSIYPGVVLQAELTIGQGAISGTLVRSGRDRPSVLEGTVLADGHVDLYVRGDFEKLRGTIHGTLTRSGPDSRRVLTGEWRDEDGRNPRPLELDETARYVSLRARKDDDLEVTCRYPVLVDGSPAGVVANRAVRDEAMGWLEDALAREPTVPRTFRALRFEDTLVEKTPQILSRLVRIVAQDGDGAPPHVTFRAENLRLVGDQVVPLRLAELFRPGSPYLQTLSTLAQEELEKVVAPTQVTGALVQLQEDDLQNFTISPSALEFVIPSSRAGTPGPDDVLVSIPLTPLAHLLDPQGPLGGAAS